jgi:hypothetical protein
MNELGSINSEIESLMNKRDAIEWKISVFQEKLQELGQGAQKAAMSDNAERPRANGSLANLGMRDAVRHILSESPKAMKTGDIAKALLEGGFKYSGSVDLTNRISNELSRMARLGKVKRSKRHGKLYFSLPNQGGE